MKRDHHRLRVCFAAAALLLAPAMACASDEGPKPVDPATSGDRPYVIGIPDLLRVTVWKYPDLSVEAPVRRDGKISVPLVEDVQAAGLTPEELASEIKQALTQYVTRPDVTVIVLSPDSQVVTVMGGVQQSGPVPIRGAMGVAEAIGAAGGFTPWANKRDVRVIRIVDGERVSFEFNYKAYLRGKSGSDILLEPGDVIMVPE
jgi:polysaccharide export outer membrane protein